MHTKSLILVLLLLSAGVAHGADDDVELPRVAVTDFQTRRGADPALARVIEGFLVDQISALGRYSVISRQDIIDMLDHEQRRRLLGCEQESCLAQIGGAMGVDWLIAGSIDKVGESTLVALKMIDVRTAKVVSRRSQRMRDATEEDALDAVTGLVRRLFRLRDTTGLPKLAMTEIVARKGVDPSLARVVEEYLVDQIVRTGRYDVIGRDDIQRMLEFEGQRRLLACEAESCLAEIGGALGAKKLLGGSLARVGESTLISLALIDVQRARVERRESGRFTSPKDEYALDAATLLFKRMFKLEPDVKPTPAPAPTPSAGTVTAPEPASGGDRIWTWIATGVAAAALAAGVGLEAAGAVELADADDLLSRSREDDNQVRYEDYLDTKARGDDEALAGHILLGVGGACAVAALVLYFTEGGEVQREAAGPGPKRVRVAPLAGRSGGGVVLGGRF